MKSNRLSDAARSAIALASAVLLTLSVSCGGGGVGSGGTGSPAQGVVQGTVNGFGSVIVDGSTFDVRSASVVVEYAPGADRPSDVKLGHRVSVTYLTGDLASVVRPEAAVVGPVAAVDASGQLTVLGQRVAINSVGSLGPITQLGGGYASMADIHVGDAVEVHGILLLQGGGYALQATRVDKLTAVPDYLRVSGLVSATSAGGTAFNLGALGIDAAAASLLPAGGAVANGEFVTVLAAAGTLATTSASWHLRAAQVRVGTLRDQGLDDYVSGSVSNLDVQARSFMLGGLSVRYGAAALTPAAGALSVGNYVQVRGMVGSDGALRASAVTIRDAGSDSESELKGNVLDFDAATKAFTVRGVRVDAAAATLQGCPVAGLSDGLFVEVEGKVSSTGVVARKIECDEEPPGATIEREGTASSVDATARSFTLTTGHAAVIAVQWSASTYFGGVTAATLAGKAVQVEGALTGTTLIASRVTAND